MSGDLAFNYEDLYYIKTRSNTDKRAKETWGGYSQEYDEAEYVYSHEQVVEDSETNWGVCGIHDRDHASIALLVFDLDVHKAPDDFDPDTISVPSDTVIVRSQNGGMHVYFIVHAERGEGAESDFAMTEDLGWDIDIRGSYVNHHVCAPSDIPGVGGKYEIVNDKQILTVTDPADAAERIQYKGEPLLEYDTHTGIADFDYERDVEAPDEMPTCYHAGLQLRKAAPDDHPNTHKVNTLTALCGLAAGYSVDEMVEHFCYAYAPGSDADKQETRYQLEHMAGKMDRGSLAPPSISSLKDWGILAADETCKCDIDYHGGAGASSKPTFDIVAEAAAASDGGIDTKTESSGSGGSIGKRSLNQNIEDVLRIYAEDNDMEQRTVIHRVALFITEAHSFVHPPDDARGWRTTLYRYDGEEGIYVPDGERFIREISERYLGDFLNNQQANELVGKITRLSGVDKDELRVEPYRLVVGNGILDLRTGDLYPHDPDEYHRTKITVDYRPEAECPQIDEFFHEIVEAKDVSTLYQLAAHTLYREYAAEKAAMLVGDGRNGKSVFLDLLEHFVGGENVTHRSLQDLDGERFAANDLEGKLANFHPDMGDEKIHELDTFKKLTGRDTMIADVKYENPIKFENYASLIFATNRMPAIDEDTHALWRRWIYLNFPNTFEPNDPDHVPKRVLMRELTADSELEGLLARCVEEISEWWGGRDWFTNTLAPDQVRKKMKRASEPIYDFVSICLELDEEASVPKDDARRAYREYARAEGLPAVPDNVFGERIMNIRDYPIEGGQERHNGMRRRVYKGVTFSSRGRQVLGLDEPEDDAQRAVDDEGPRARAEVILEAMRGLGADETPVSRPMIIGRACASINMAQAEHGFENLKDHGGIYQPADADDGHWMIA